MQDCSSNLVTLVDILFFVERCDTPTISERLHCPEHLVEQALNRAIDNRNAQREQR